MNQRMISPYDGLEVNHWEAKTRELISQHPLDPQELVEVSLKSWNDIYSLCIGEKPYIIGQDLFPKPQIMGFFLHELIALELSERYKGIWRKEQAGNEKDMVYVPDDTYSVEIKTSSSAGRIFGNRSYAQEAKSEKKTKAGYYLAINFQKFTRERQITKVTEVRFGWLDRDDWVGQKAATGQQSRLRLLAEHFKLVELYRL